MFDCMSVSIEPQRHWQHRPAVYAGFPAGNHRRGVFHSNFSSKERLSYARVHKSRASSLLIAAKSRRRARARLAHALCLALAAVGPSRLPQPSMRHRMWVSIVTMPDFARRVRTGHRCGHGTSKSIDARVGRNLDRLLNRRHRLPRLRHPRVRRGRYPVQLPAVLLHRVGATLCSSSPHVCSKLGRAFFGASRRGRATYGRPRFHSFPHRVSVEPNAARLSFLIDPLHFVVEARVAIERLLECEEVIQHRLSALVPALARHHDADARRVD